MGKASRKTRARHHRMNCVTTEEWTIIDPEAWLVVDLKEIEAIEFTKRSTSK